MSVCYNRDQDIHIEVDKLNHKWRGMLYTVVSALLFGLTPVLARVTFDMGSNAGTLTFYRNIMVVPVLLILMRIKKIPFSITGKQAGLLILIGVGFCTSTTYMLYESYQYVGIGTATTLHFLYPVVTAIVCRCLFKEHLGVKKLAALCTASIGVGFFFEKGGLLGLPGIVLAVASAITYSFYMIGMDKTQLRNMNPNKVACYFGIANAAAMFLLDMFKGDIVYGLPPKAMLYTFIIALCTSFVGVALLQMGIKALGASTAAIFCMFEPITSVLSGWLILGERMSAAKLLGCIVILGAVTVLIVSDNKGQKTKCGVQH